MKIKVALVAMVLSLVFTWSCQKESALTPNVGGSSAKDTEQFTANSGSGIEMVNGLLSFPSKDMFNYTKD